MTGLKKNSLTFMHIYKVTSYHGLCIIVDNKVQEGKINLGTASREMDVRTGIRNIKMS